MVNARRAFFLASPKHFDCFKLRDRDFKVLKKPRSESWNWNSRESILVWAWKEVLQTSFVRLRQFKINPILKKPGKIYLLLLINLSWIFICLCFSKSLLIKSYFGLRNLKVALLKFYIELREDVRHLLKQTNKRSGLRDFLTEPYKKNETARRTLPPIKEAARLWNSKVLWDSQFLKGPFVTPL